MNNENINEIKKVKEDINYYVKGSTSQIEYYAKTIILTTGTFLNGKIFIGNTSYNAGRLGEFSSIVIVTFPSKDLFTLTLLISGSLTKSFVIFVVSIEIIFG